MAVIHWMRAQRRFAPLRSRHARSNVGFRLTRANPPMLSFHLYADRHSVNAPCRRTSGCDGPAVIEEAMSVLARSHFLRWVARPLIPVIAALLALLAATGFLGLRYWQQLQAVNQALEHSRQVIDTLDRLRTIITDLEAERHGYLLTLDPAYLKAYGVSDDSIRREAEALQALVTDDPLQSLRAAHLALTVSA